jgi:DNA adenine methylase/adenine-specific DNA-methyltransferase
MASLAAVREQLRLYGGPVYPDRVKAFPQLRYMGSKYRLLPWIHEVLSYLEFDTALDAFSGSGCVAYLLKCMGKRVIANDFLEFCSRITQATIENSTEKLSGDHYAELLAYNRRRRHFVESTYKGIFFTPQDLRFLDNIWANLPALPSEHHRALAIAALTRSCVKRQPRGVFTVAGDPERYKDGRRDLRLSLEEHFIESAEAYNATVFNNGESHQAIRGDIFDVDPAGIDLVYMDPPYVPRSDDNCYIKRYHFLEGLASYWQGEETEILEATKVKKLKKRYTPFSYRRTAVEAFDKLFRRFRTSTLVLSYSSNGYPDLERLVSLMGRYKSEVEVFEREHRYHFGTHNNVSQDRVTVREYLIVGS